MSMSFGLMSRSIIVSRSVGTRFSFVRPCSGSSLVNWKKLDVIYPVYTYPSIESIKLKMDDKTKAPRQMYGLIKVPFPCLPIFYRHGNNPQQLVPDPDREDMSDGFPLILCGPNHWLSHDEMCQKITVDLYGERSQPFITGEFILTDNTYNGRVQVPLQEYLYLPDGSGRLTLTYTRILHSHPTIFQFRLIHGLSEPAAVTGTIRGIHRLPEGSAAPNWLTIFDSRGEAVAVHDREPIPLDRFNFIVPVQIGKEGEKGFYGGSFDIDVDLQVVVHHKVFSIKGETKVSFSRIDIMEKIWNKFFTVGQSPSDGPLIQISVKRFHDYPDVDEIETVEH